MFLIWYVLNNLIYFILLIVRNIIFTGLKLNSKFLDSLILKGSSFNDYYLKVTPLLNINGSNHNIFKMDFKALYLENSYFLKANKNSFKLNLLTNYLNQKVLNKLHYTPELNYILSLITETSKQKSASKLKLNLFTIHNNITGLLGSPKLVQFSKFTSNRLSKTVTSVVSVVTELSNKVNLGWVVKYSPSNFLKYVSLFNTNAYTILFLRKNKVFNKGRYSRNRQYYRTGVYWCLYVNIIAVIGIYFWFYRFTMNFGYLWWLLFIFIASFIVPKAIKYRSYNVRNLVQNFYKDLLWITIVYTSIISSILKILKIAYNKFCVVFSFNSAFFKITSVTSFNFLIPLYVYTSSFAKQSAAIYTWEFTNINYYYGSIIKSRPVILEKGKLRIAQFFYFCFAIK